MKKLAQVVLRAAKIHEDSFDDEEANRAIEERFVDDFEQFYKVSLIDAVDIATEECGFDLNVGIPAHTLLKYQWEESLAWAGVVLQNKLS